MDEGEFRRLLLLFPVVRSRDYHTESEKSKESTSKSAESEALKEWHDAWDEGEKKDMEKETRDGHGMLKLHSSTRHVLLFGVELVATP
ncbi:hypothetical protein ACLB2K_026325 [Fragaria x ananassa]